MKQPELSELSGVSQPQISVLTREPLTEQMTAAVISRLALALDVSLDYLLIGRGESVPHLYSPSVAPLPSKQLRTREDELPALNDPPRLPAGEDQPHNKQR